MEAALERVQPDTQFQVESRCFNGTFNDVPRTFNLIDLDYSDSEARHSRHTQMFNRIFTVLIRTIFWAFQKIVQSAFLANDPTIEKSACDCAGNLSEPSSDGFSWVVGLVLAQ